jgi:hypothetical protein
VIATCERCLASSVLIAGTDPVTGQLFCAGCAGGPGGPLGREESRRALLADMAPKVHDQATANMASAIADEFSRYGVTGIAWADPE